MRCTTTSSLRPRTERSEPAMRSEDCDTRTASGPETTVSTSRSAEPSEPAAPRSARRCRYRIRNLMGVAVTPLRARFWTSNVPRIAVTPERTIRLPGRVSVNRTGKI